MIQARLRKHFPPGEESSAFTLDLDLQTSAGVTVLFGPSGAGKTLTLDCIAGFAKPAEGRIVIDDAVLFDATTAVNLSPQDRRCGYVFQNYALFPHMTLRQNLQFAAERLPRLERHRRVTEMLERFHLDEVAGRKPHELSGGQKQRTSIARALLAAPRILLLDEPAIGLDLPLKSELYAAIRQVRSDFGTPVLLVTHDLNECFELADHMIVVREGRIAQSGPPLKVLDQPAGTDVATLLGMYNLLPVEIRTLDPGNNSSRLRFEEFDLTGPYLPGRFRGDRVTLYIRPDQLTATPKDGKATSNAIPATLLRVTELMNSVRLEFTNGLRVESPRSEFAKSSHNSKEWTIHFPSEAIRVL
jgi:molybdate transport system ATP-binding protein